MDSLPWTAIPSNTSPRSLCNPDGRELGEPVEQRRVTIEVKVTGANGIVGRSRHVITVVP